MNKIIVTLIAIFLTCHINAGMVNLELQGPQSVQLNEEFNVSLIASGNNTMMATDVIIGWNVNEVQLIGISHQNSHPLILKFQSGLLYPDFYGINESAIPTDGTALYTGFVQLGNSINASNPFEITSFRFKAINLFESTTISILPSLDILYPCETSVYGGNIAGNNVTGIFTNAYIIPTPGVISLIIITTVCGNRRRR